MKNEFLFLFLCAATSGICQTAAPAPLGPLEPGQAPPTFTPPPTDFGKPQSSRRIGSFKLPRIFVTPKMIPPSPWNDARMDPKIISHPPQSKLAVQLPGTQVAQNEYPNLLLLPIGSPSVTPRATPAQWPKFALKPIPILWPKLKLLPVHAGLQEIPQSSAK